MPILEAVRLTKTYGSHRALNDLHLSLAAGEIYCLLGQNGAGKTTTLNIFLGFIEPSSGVARIRDLPVQKGGATTRKFTAYIPEVVNLYEHLTAVENLDYFSRLAGYKYDQQALEKQLTLAGLGPESMEKRLKSFSKGMRQKVGIAIALAKNADLIFMDEPTSGLDPKATQEFTDIVKWLGTQGKTILMATHDIFNAVSIGTTIGIMNKGELKHQIPTRDVTASELQELYLQTI